MMKARRIKIARIAITKQIPAAPKQWKPRLRARNDDYLIMEKDIADETQVKEICDTVTKRFGKADILVNKASVNDENGNDTIETITQQVIDHTFSVNVRGTLLMISYFIKNFKNNGRIINLSTDAAQSFAGQITYGASKATLEALTRSIAREVGKYKITVNSVAPGSTQTGWIDEEHEQRVISEIPMGQLIQPKDIVNTILFLASKQAGMLTGQVIKVSGGHAV